MYTDFSIFQNDIKGFAAVIRSNQDLEVIIVHGGGKEISQALKDAGRKTVFIDGNRVTQSADEN